ncbi:MAG: hypothetical protein MZV64_05010 [Ignavibacteriales bacterium]|nr:hypothetical protein [Ignavibacteriales bacterium]
MGTGPAGRGFSGSRGSCSHSFCCSFSPSKPGAWHPCSGRPCSWRCCSSRRPSPPAGRRERRHAPVMPTDSRWRPSSRPGTSPSPP